MSRVVTLKLTSQKDVITHTTDAVTYGELQGELPNISFNGMRVVERGTKMTLQSPEAILPTEDFILFLVPEKVKSGLKKKEIAVANYAQLRKYAMKVNEKKDANILITPNTESLRTAILNWKVSKAEEVNPNAEMIERIEVSRDSINEVINQIIRELGSDDIEEVVDYLDTEVASLREELGI